MRKTRLTYFISLLLTILMMVTPLCVIHADEGVDVSVQTDSGNVNITSIKNTTNKNVVGWTVTIRNVPAEATIGSDWNANISLSGGTLTFKSSEDWNSTIEAGTTNSDIRAGCYLKDAGDWKPGPGDISIKPTFEKADPPAPGPDPKKEDPPKPGPDPKKEDPPKPGPDPTEASPTPIPATATPVPATATPAPTSPDATSTPTPAPANTNTPTPSSSTSDSSETSEPAESTSETGAGTVEPTDGDDWLTTDGNKIVDMNGTQVWLTGINWFGYNTGTNIFDGCWSVNMDQALKAIADHGFNLLRIPISAELALAWRYGEYPQANFNQATNPELVGMNSLEIFDYAISLCRKYGIKVMIDIHSANTDAAGHMTNLWYTDSMTLQDYLDGLGFLANRYKNNDTVVAYDLKNEPHGKPNEEKAIWNNSEEIYNWKFVAEKAGNLVLDANPNALIVIEGIEIYPKDLSTNGDFSSTNDDDYYFNWWGANLRGVRDYPIDFGSPERNKQIVYSPHDYGPAVFAQTWFEGEYTFESLKEDCWEDNWLFIHEENIAPILIGEWGGFMTEPNLTWMTYLRQLISEEYLNYTFWCFNANSGDTGGLVLDDFTTWDEEKYAFVKEVLWQDQDKFVGLDHAVPLGDNGISLSEYTGTIVPLHPATPETTDTTVPVTEETAAPDETSAPTTAAPTPAPTYENLMAKQNVITPGLVILYIFLALLLLFILFCAYLYLRRPEAWNRLIDRFYLPEKLKRNIPNTAAAQTTSNTAGGMTSMNNEFAGKYRPVKKEEVSEMDNQRISPFTGKPVERPAAPTPAARPVPHRPVNRPDARSQAASPVRSEDMVSHPSPFHSGPAKTAAKEAAAAMKPAETKPVEEVAEKKDSLFMPTWASGPSRVETPIWAKPAAPVEDEPVQHAPIKRPNMRPAAQPKNDPNEKNGPNN